MPLLAVVLCVAAALSWGAGNVAARSAGVSGGLSLTVWSGLPVPVTLLRSPRRRRAATAQLAVEEAPGRRLSPTG